MEEGGAQEGAAVEESYVVDCPCGIKYDDGAMMVECEQCKTWAHIDCLQHQATTNPTVVNYDFNHYMCLACQNKRNSAHIGGLNMIAGLPIPVGIPTSRASRANKSRLNGNPPADGEAEGGEAGLTTRYSRDRTQEAGHVLLGLANGDLQPREGGAPDVPARPSSRAGLKREQGSLPLHPVPVSAGSGSADWMDNLSMFLANSTGRPSSALGHRTNSPRANPTSPSKSAGNRSRDKAGGRQPEVDMSSSQQNLDKLLAAANAQESADALAAARNSSLRNGTDGRASPNPAGMLKRAGSAGPGAVPGGPVVGSTMSAFNSMASMNPLNRPASRGPAAELFGDSDDDHHAALSQLMGAGNDIVMQLLSGNRSATPSQLFLDQLLRGATPVQNAAVAGLAAAASAQLQFLQQGMGAATGPVIGGADAASAAATGAPGVAHLVQAGAPAAGSVVQVNRPAGSQGLDELMQLAAASAMSTGLGLHPLELRPGTPDTWAMLRGSTPTPDALGLHAFGIPPLASFPADSQWLLQRSSPALISPELAALAHSAHMQQQAVMASTISKMHQQMQQQQQGGGKAQGDVAAAGDGDAAEGAGAGDGAGAAAAAGKGAAGGKEGGEDEAGKADADAVNGKDAEHKPTSSAGAKGGDSIKAEAANGDEKSGGDQQRGSEGGGGAAAGSGGAGVVKTEQGAAAAAAAQAEAAASAAAAAAANAVSSSGGGVLVGAPAMAAVMSELVDRKGSLGALTGAGELAAVVAACGHTEEFNVDDMLRSNTPAPR